MPWPMRLGPLPRIMTFLRSTGSASPRTSIPVPGQLHVGDTVALGLADVRGGNGIESNLLQLGVELHDLRDLLQEPGVDRRHLLDLSDAAPAFQSEPDIVQPVGRGGDQFLRDELRVVGFGAERFAGLEAAQSLPQKLITPTPDR